MKTIIQTLTALALVFLVSCTSNEKAFKNAAEEAARTQFAATVEEEARGYLTQSEAFKNAYVSYMVKFAEFSAEEIKMNGESSGVTTVFITSYAPDVRKKMLQVASTVKSSAVGNFNFANAYQLIAKETGLPGEPMKYPFATLSLKKDAKGDWIVLK